MEPDSPISEPDISPNEVATGTLDREIARIHRHPFGIVIIYIEAIIGLVGAIGLLYFLLPQFIAQDTNKSSMVLAIFSTLTIGITTVLLLIAAFIYRLSILVITDEHLTQVVQKGLFRRKVSQLSMANVEDVTSQKEGIFPTLLNFGTLKIETAGEQNNFDFTYCPNPDYYANMVLAARERYIQSDPTRANRANYRLHMKSNTN
ncbi:MAG TPA: PH domain-containing protein [Patescibacteria group bacterium]|nr:PH domain-containing protein [Patescibacteria group bacterium]